MRRAPAHSDRGEAGAALLIALGALALISALAAGALALTASPIARATAAVERAQAVRTAEAAAHRLMVAMAERELRAAAPLDGSVVSTTFLNAEMDFAAQDVAGLIDANLADEATLARLFSALGVARGAEAAAAVIAARGDDRRAFPAVESALSALPEDLAAAAAPALDHMTVWSGRATVDPWVATAPAFAAAAAIPLAEAQRFVAERTLAGRAAAPPPDADLSALAVSDGGTARLTVRAATAGGGRAEIVATLRITGSPRAPVAILDWR